MSKGHACRQAGFAPIIILLGIALIVLIGGVVVYQKVLAPKANPTPTPAVSPTPDPTATWGTCTNTKEGFSLKYPEDFEIDPTTCNYAIMDYGLVKDIKITTPFDDFGENWLLTLSVEKSSKDIDQWIKEKNFCPNDFESCSKQTPGPILNSTEFDQINRHYAGTHVIVKRSDSILDISLNARNPNVPVDLKIRNIFNQILSTFKFLD